MYNLNSKFNTFYSEHVVLSRKEKKLLRERKDINIDRLKKGLAEYNEENSTSYKLKDYVVQGSVAMSTVTQNENKDYDIDVAIIFDKDDLPEGTITTKNIIVDALKRKCGQFNTEPEYKTNCIRIQYSEGYHIDFAIYRRSKNYYGEYDYEHCGSDWRSRDPRAINNWFKDENFNKNNNLRKVVRLLKMFCKSRNYWDLPGGLVQTVLVNENLQECDRVDEMFYKTINEIRNRLFYNKEVYNPTDVTQNLTFKSRDITRMSNLHNRLTTHIEKLDQLFDDSCSEEEAIKAWEEFFNHSYWSSLGVYERAESVTKDVYAYYEDTEEFIQDYFNLEIQNKLTIDCDVLDQNKTIRKLSNMLHRGEQIVPEKILEFHIKHTNVSHPYSVYWKIKNNGPTAIEKDCIRGQICQGDTPDRLQDYAAFDGNHYVECYLIKNGKCVAVDRIEVPISYQ